MNLYSRVTYQGTKRAYDFMLARDTDGSYVAVCNLPEGGINTCHKSFNVLLKDMIPDAVQTWEMDSAPVQDHLAVRIGA